MELQEAIRITGFIAADIDVGQPDQDLDALQLLIEAGQLVLRERLLAINPVETLLPGETKE